MPINRYIWKILVLPYIKLIVFELETQLKVTNFWNKGHVTLWKNIGSEEKNENHIH